MSRWNAPNDRQPAWLVVLLLERPSCFSDESWESYLEGVRNEAMGEPALRRRMERGAMPLYCQDCRPEHRAAMEQAGRCAPLKGFER